MLRIIYAGTPEFAVPALQALADSKHRVVAVYTQPDRPAGRGRRLQQSPVKQAAVNLNIPVFQPESLRQIEEVKQLKGLHADLMVVAAYGLILPVDILDAPRLGCINIHASLLPRWRGAAPVQRAILAGDTETGITIMKMAKGLDTGDMLTKQSVKINPDWNAGDLHDRLMQVGADLLIPTIDGLVAGRLVPEVQDESQVTYADKLIKSEAEIDWSKEAAIIHREIRAYAPWPVSFSRFEGQPVRIWRAQSLSTVSVQPAGQIIEHDKGGLLVSCGAGVLKITELQFAGRKKCHPAQLLGARNLTGLAFG
jgi:methionyl-tRNA formyltransferase